MVITFNCVPHCAGLYDTNGYDYYFENVFIKNCFQIAIAIKQSAYS